jgi:hypothetical protein
MGAGWHGRARTRSTAGMIVVAARAQKLACRGELRYPIENSSATSSIRPLPSRRQRSKAAIEPSLIGVRPNSSRFGARRGIHQLRIDSRHLPR